MARTNHGSELLVARQDGRTENGALTLPHKRLIPVRCMCNMLYYAKCNLFGLHSFMVCNALNIQATLDIARANGIVIRGIANCWHPRVLS